MTPGRRRHGGGVHVRQVCRPARGGPARRSPGARPTARGGCLLTDFYPRTATLALDSLRDYRALQQHHARARGPRAALDEVARLAGQHASATAALLCDQVAAAVVRALDKVLAEEPAMPRHLREETYNWLALMPGLRGKEKRSAKSSSTGLRPR